MSLKQVPELWQFIMSFLAMAIAAAIGATAKIADDIKSGDRTHFWTPKLWLDFPAVLMMALVAVSLAEYFDLTAGIAAGLGVTLGWAGPRIVDVFIGNKLAEWGKRK